MIKAFLFDYGGVITNGGRREANGRGGFEPADRLAAGLGISSSQAFELIDAHWDDYARGKIAESALWELIEKDYGQPIDVAQRNIWNSWEAHMQPLPEMLELVADLKRRGFPVGLLSNVIPITAQDIRDHNGYDAFDFLVLSCECGYAKPETEIYNIALSKLPGVAPEEVVFIDDQEKCILPAQALGLQTIFAENARQIAADIYKLLDEQA